MNAATAIAVMAIVTIVSGASYACGLFRFGMPLESEWWRYGSLIVDALALGAVFFLYWRSRP